MTLPTGDVITYLVDGMGRRVGKEVNGVLVQGWLWRGRLQPVAELDGAGNVVARFTYAGRGNVPVLMTTTSGSYRLVKDHLGSVRQVVEVTSGVVVEELTYDAWGRVLEDTFPGFEPFGFAGGLRDLETDLVRFGERDYAAELGRWTSEDPVRFPRGGLNRQAYAADDPVNRRDPRGRDAGALTLLFGGGDASTALFALGYPVALALPIVASIVIPNPELGDDTIVGGGGGPGPGTAVGTGTDEATDDTTDRPPPPPPDYSNCFDKLTYQSALECCEDICGAIPGRYGGGPSCDYRNQTSREDRCVEECMDAYTLGI